ncbi:MAG: GntP family permease [Planctomycetaceae bacterium]|nr:GntP family permease [Planctomycetaceae bacterium]
MSETALTLTILLTGIVVVIGSVLVLKLHAFLALILGALVVATLTPAASVARHQIRQSGFTVVSADDYSKFVTGDGETISPTQYDILLRIGNKQSLQERSTCLVLPTDDLLRDPEQASMLLTTGQVAGVTESGRSHKIVVATILSGPPDAKIVAGSIAIRPADRAKATSIAHNKTVGARVAEGFGNTCTKIAILIAMASIIGKCLLDSGAADRVVRSTLKLLGERGAPLSFLTSGFLLGVPVFFDTVFYLMIPLGKAMRMRTGRNYLLYVLTIVAGATMAHSLVPPTPGPLFVAEQLGVDIGVMILAGGIVGLFTAGFGYFYAGLANRWWELPLRESPDFSLEELKEITDRDESDLPPTWLALMPILLPVILIGGNTILNQFKSTFPAGLLDVARTLGDKNIALTISAAIAMAMLVWKKRTSRVELAKSIQMALAGGGVIILITAGGGAFGGVLQQTGVASLIGNVNQSSPWVIILIAFAITTAVRTAQGSATVAMITSVGILSGLAESLSFHPVYLALAIGCGSKPIGWMNDSGFWVITKMSGMTETEGLKYVTPMTSMMGVVGLIVVLVGVTLFPMR